MIEHDFLGRREPGLVSEDDRKHHSTGRELAVLLLEKGVITEGEFLHVLGNPDGYSVVSDPQPELIGYQVVDMDDGKTLLTVMIETDPRAMATCHAWVKGYAGSEVREIRRMPK